MHVLNLSFFGKNKLSLIIIIAVIIACILIYISFFTVIKTPMENFLKPADIFNADSYFAEYEITEISNKNRNIYTMNELYKREGTNEYFKLVYKDFLGNDVTYIVTNDRVKISNSSQISSYIISSNIFKKTNLFSLATYIDLINNIDDISCINLNVSKEEEFEKYVLTLNKQIHSSKCLEEGTCKYLDLFSNGLKLSKIELIIKDNSPVDVLVYTNDDNIYINIKYITFELNNQVSEDIFKF